MNHPAAPFNGHARLRLLSPHDGMIYADCHLHQEAWGIECENEEDAARIVACVNACAGIEDPAATLAEVREVLRGLLFIAPKHNKDGIPSGWLQRGEALLAKLATP